MSLGCVFRADLLGQRLNTPDFFPPNLKHIEVQGVEHCSQCDHHTTQFLLERTRRAIVHVIHEGHTLELAQFEDLHGFEDFFQEPETAFLDVVADLVTEAADNPVVNGNLEGGIGIEHQTQADSFG